MRIRKVFCTDKLRCCGEAVSRARARRRGVASRREAEAAEARQLEGGAADVDAEHGAEKIDLNTFDPAQRQAEIAAEGGADAGAGRREADDFAAKGKILADRGGRQ